MNRHLTWGYGPAPLYFLADREALQDVVIVCVQVHRRICDGRTVNSFFTNVQTHINCY
jgi:hypothetical protein